MAARTVAGARTEHLGDAVLDALDVLVDTASLSVAFLVRVEEDAPEQFRVVAAARQASPERAEVPRIPRLWTLARALGALALDAAMPAPPGAAAERDALNASGLLPCVIVPCEAGTGEPTGLLLVHENDAPPSADLTPDLVNLAQVLALATRTSALNATLSRSTARFRDYSETVSDWFWETDAENRITYVSTALARHTLVDASAYLGLEPWNIAANVEGPDDSPWVEHRGRVQARLPFRELRFRRRRADGVVRHFSTSGRPVHDAAGHFIGYRGIGRDVTDEALAEEALATKTRQLELTLDCMDQGIAVHDAELNMVTYNQVLVEMLELPEHILAPGTPIEEIVRFTARRGEYGPGDVEDLVRTRMERIRNNPPREYSRTTPSGRILDVRCNLTPEGMMVLIFTDVTDQRSLHAQIEHSATHDLLTGLINRGEFEVQLEQLVDDARTGQRRHALIYLDLDQFKVVNDTCGHAAGDDLLRQLGARLIAELRQGDTIARLGGDEFGVLVHGCTVDNALAVAEKLRAVVDRFRFTWDARHFKLSVSMGIAFIEAGGPDASRLLGQADAACFTAKDTGRNRIHVYKEDDEESGERHSQMHWVSRIHAAIEENRLALFHQEIVPLQATLEEDLHFEVLLRMRDEFGALVPPGAFLGAAERYSLSARLDYWVVDSCLDWLAANPALSERISLCSINLSGASLGDERLLGRLLERISEPGLDASRLCFEITETAVISRLRAANVFIEKLRDEGCMFALDDFGTGLSSFGYLRNLPIDIVKIDGTFVRDMLRNRLDRAMVDSINGIAQQMGKLTVAEFVEDDATVRLLASLGVDYAQGYHFGKPAPLVDLT